MSYIDDSWGSEEGGDAAAQRASDGEHTPSSLGVPGPPEPATISELLDEAIQVVTDARPAPMSSMAKVDRDELLDLLEDIRDLMPEEIRAARWLLRERDHFLAEARRERDAIVEQGRSEVARIVERQAVVAAGEDKARRIVTQARDDARQTRRQLDDYCDRKLASFERMLSDTMSAVTEGRQRLTASIDLTGLSPDEDTDFETLARRGDRRRSRDDGARIDQVGEPADESW